MPTARSTVRRGAAALALLVAVSGCSLSGSGQDSAEPSDSAATASSAGPTATASSAGPGAATGAADDASISTEEETCARVVEAARTAPQQLTQDPLALLEELTALADTAPAELSAQIGEVRDAVAGFRQGERRLTEVVREVRELQQRCAA